MTLPASEVGAVDADDDAKDKDEKDDTSEMDRCMDVVDVQGFMLR